MTIRQVISCEQHDGDGGNARLTLRILQGDAVTTGKAARDDHMVSVVGIAASCDVR
jgi:hypothetical protein